MEEIAPVDPLSNGDWIAEVNIADDESSSEVNEYLLSWVNDHSSDAMSNTILVKECLGKSGKYIRERERESERESEREKQLSDLATQLNQLSITSNQYMVHADVHDRKEAVRARKSPGAFNQSQHTVKIHVDRGMLNIQELYQLKQDHW